MNEEQIRQLQDSILNESDPDRQRELMDTLNFVMSNRQALGMHGFDGGGTGRQDITDLRTGETIVPGSGSPFELPPAPGQTVGEFFNPEGSETNPFNNMTAGQIATLLAQRDGAQAAASTGVDPNTGLPPGVFAFTPGTRDLFQQAGLGPGSEFVERLLLSRQAQIDDIINRQRESQARLSGLETGEIDVARSELPDRFRVANNAEDFARLRDEGFIPIMAQDSEMIRRLGQEQAVRIRQAAETDLQDASAARRAAIFQQIASGFGIGIGSAISRTNAGADGTLDRVANLAEQTRQELLGAQRGRTAADVRAGEFDTRAQLDAMLAETDAFRQVQGMLTQAARDDELRRFAEIERTRAIIEQQQRDLDNIRGNEASFMTNLVQAQKLANDPIPTQLVTDPALRRSGASAVGINQATQARLVRAASRLRENLDALATTNRFTTPNANADAVLQEYQAEIAQIAEDLDKVGGKAILSREVEGILSQALEIDARASGILTRGGEGVRNFLADDTEDILRAAVGDDTDLINANLQSILSSTQGGLATSSRTRGSTQTVSDVNKAASRFARGAN